MAFNIEEFKANGLRFGGARPSLFNVIITDWPGSTSDASSQLRFVVKAAQLPPSIEGQVEVPYFGRRIKVIGDRVYTNWNVTVMNDEDFNIKRSMENWHQAMNQHIENVMFGVSPAPVSYKRDAIVQQFSKSGSLLETYTMKGIFPVSIDAIPLAWEAIDQYEQFDVEFSVDYWLPYADSGQDEVDAVLPPNARFNIDIAG